MSETTRFLFDGRRLEPVTWCSPTRHTVSVADSWRVVEGSAVSWERHLERFQRSVEEVAPEVLESLDTFVDLTLSMIPPTGEWFPRWEVVDTGHGHTLHFLHREAPPRLSDAILHTSDHDPRLSPLIKGPDLERLMALRQSVTIRGANEAVIVSPGGDVVEGAYSSVIAWPEGQQEMWVVDESLPRIPSVTEATLVDIAHQHDIPTVRKRFTPAHLEGSVVWVVSALHGIRHVSRWLDGPNIANNREFSSNWQTSLLAARTGLPTR